MGRVRLHATFPQLRIPQRIDSGGDVLGSWRMEQLFNEGLNSGGRSESCLPFRGLDPTLWFGWRANGLAECQWVAYRTKGRDKGFFLLSARSAEAPRATWP